MVGKKASGKSGPKAPKKKPSPPNAIAPAPASDLLRRVDAHNLSTEELTQVLHHVAGVLHSRSVLAGIAARPPSEADEYCCTFPAVGDNGALWRQTESGRVYQGPITRLQAEAQNIPRC